MDRDSGNRRVKNNVDACRYILEIWEEACRVEEEEREETDDERSGDEVNVSLVELRVVAIEPLEAIVGLEIFWAREMRVLNKGREILTGMSDEDCRNDGRAARGKPRPRCCRHVIGDCFMHSALICAQHR